MALSGTRFENYGRETERKARVTIDQQHLQSPGGKEHQPQIRIKNGTVQEPYIMEVLPHWQEF